MPEAPIREGRLDKRDFDIDLQAAVVTCPAGHAAPIRTDPSGRRRAGFSRSVCGSCPLKPRCTPTQPHRQVRLAPEEDLLIAARQALDDPFNA